MTGEKAAQLPQDKYSKMWKLPRGSFLVYGSNEFVVYIDPHFDLEWETKDAYEARLAKNPEDGRRRPGLLNRAAAIECVPNNHHPDAVRLNFKRMIGEGLARSLNGDYDSASAMLDTAEAYILNRNMETARFWQLSVAWAMGGAFCVFGILVCLCRSLLSDCLGPLAVPLSLAFVAGCLGAVLSMTFRMGHTRTTSEAPWRLHVLEAAARVAGGGLAGGIVACLVKIGILVPVAKSAESDLAMVTLAFVAGATERWVPSIISKIESGVKNGFDQEGEDE